MKLRGRIHPGKQLECPRQPPESPEGDVELIVLYEREHWSEEITPLSPPSWPLLDGGRYLGGTLRRDELYNVDGR